MRAWLSTGYGKLWGAIGAFAVIAVVFGVIQSVPGPSEVGGRLAGDTLSRADWAERLAEAAGAVYLIETMDCDGEILGTGTGFLSDNWLITNAHVLEDASRVSVRPQTGRKLEALRWSLDETVDLGVLSFDFGVSPQLELAKNNPIEGALVATVGHPLGGDLEIRDGRVLKFVGGEDIGRDGATYLGLTSEALPGDSGGPAIGSSGEVLGVTSALLRKDNLALAIPVEELSSYLRDVGTSTFTYPCSGGAG